MKELVLDVIASYENRISKVDELITAYQVTATPDESLAALDKERERLKTILQETLAKNCSLRRRDFSRLIERVLFDSQRKRTEIEEEQKRVRKELKEYLDRQKELAACLRQQLGEFMQDKADKDGLMARINEFKTAYQDKGGQVFTLLGNFQSHLEIFQREQEEINHKLQGLISRGESLRIEDLRQLEAAKALHERKAETELRRDDVKRLLAHFKQQRRGNRCHRSL